MRLTIIIPHRMTEDAFTTLSSLQKQSFKDYKVVVVPDQGKGANWARNQGFKECDTELVLFSDNDINWTPNGIESMIYALDRFPRASYAYGRFKIGDTIWGHQMFDPVLLIVANYISTMSVIRSKDFPGFDESLPGYQDWDLWLNLLLNHKKRGVYCNELTFTTEPREGISSTRDNLEVARLINDKYNLNLPRFRTGHL